ncbi:MAG TPA: sensor histidine kinase, partial [Gaiellaceae bacterium]|nr:sensor histidine kinase [Gaiellaceae bacterium]
PSNRLGILMVAAGFALLLRQLRYNEDALAFTTFYLLGNLGYALVAHSALAYPSGRVTDRAEGWLVRSGYATAVVFPLAVLLFYGATAPLPEFTFLPESSLLLVTASADAVREIHEAYVIVFFGILAAAFIALILRRLAKATRRAQRMLAPLLLAAIAVALRAIFEVVFTFVDAPFAYEYLFWWQVLAFAALPGALLAGLVRSHLARATVGDLVVQLERTPPDGIRDALAKGLGDPSLEVVFWLPERRAYVDRSGNPVQLPAEGGARAVTRLEHDGEPLAALVHDASLLDEPELIAAGAAAARLALENARLSAAVQAQLTTVKESRARIVAAGDEQRRRIERDLHDGAQQRLVALALELRAAQRRHGDTVDPEMERVLAAAVGELQLAVDELRELARGVHPAILTEDGLAAALESLVTRTPIPTVLEQAPQERFTPEVEATAYFVACEALANVVKHAGATKATVRATVQHGRLVVEVADDGVGGAQAVNGSGLRGLADRVEAVGGRLRVESPPSGGTQVVGEIPCGS